MLERYGGAEHLDAPPPEMRMAQSEVYVEYAPDGRVVKGPQPAVPRSKYPEDGT
jgi:pre-mRNA-processing factor SLU7